MDNQCPGDGGYGQTDEGCAATRLAFWQFENNYDDSMGNYPLFENGTVPFVPGVGVAVDFDGGFVPFPIEPGTLDYLDSASWPDKTIFNAVGLSIMGWLNHNQGTEEHAGYILSQDQSALGSSEYGYGFNVNMDGTLSFHVWNISGSLWATTSGQVPANTWSHVAATWDGSYAGGIQMYLNGAPLDAETLVWDNFTGMAGTSVPIRIGASHGSSAQTAYGLDGQLDQLSLWLGALTGDEIAADYAAGCTDNDADGYGDPGSFACDDPELDCNDANPAVHPGAAENCTNSIDDNCDGLTDGEDAAACPQPWGAAGNAEASSLGAASLGASGLFGLLGVFLLPLGMVVVLRIVRRKP